MGKKLSTAKVAAMLGISPDVLRRGLKDGTLTHLADIHVGESGRRSFVFYEERVEAHRRGERI